MRGMCVGQQRAPRSAAQPRVLFWGISACACLGPSLFDSISANCFATGAAATLKTHTALRTR
jgi:hypothetical protein